MEYLDHNWIFCEDELPDKDEVYLVLWCRTDFKKHIFYELQEFSGGKWQIDIPQAKGREVKIIAWQKLPEKPKEDLELYVY